MQNPQMIASRIKQLAKDNNISIGRLCKECGLLHPDSPVRKAANRDHRAV